METNSQSWTSTEEMKNKAKAGFEEGKEAINRAQEKAASRTPSTLFIAAALASIGASLLLQLRGNRQWSLFVGQWVPSFLLFGLYNKAVKSMGAD